MVAVSSFMSVVTSNIGRTYTQAHEKARVLRCTLDSECTVDHVKCTGATVLYLLIEVFCWRRHRGNVESVGHLARFCCSLCSVSCRH